jgi:CRISPR-associated protein Cas1
MKTIVISKYNGKIGLQENQLEFFLDNTKITLGGVDTICIYSNPTLTSQLIKFLMKREINVYYFTSHGSYLGCLQSNDVNNYERQLLQYKFSDNDESSLRLGKKTITAKIKNQKSLLDSYNKLGLISKNELYFFDNACEDIKSAKDVQQLMGYEGSAARQYFYLLGFLVPQDFKFNKRSKNPPEDAFNAMLSFGYSLLYKQIIGHLFKYGLNPGIGIIHSNRRKHATLASDLMEEWRAILIDDLVLEIVLNNEIDIDQFEEEVDDYNLIEIPKNEIYMNNEAKRKFFEFFDNRLNSKNEYIYTIPQKFSFHYALDKQIESFIKVIETGDENFYIPVCENYEE